MGALALARFSPCFERTNRASTTAAYYLYARFATIFWWLISPFVRRLATRAQGRLERTANTHLFIESRTACAVRVRHTCACIGCVVVVVAYVRVCVCTCVRGYMEEENERASNRFAKRKTRVRANSFVKKSAKKRLAPSQKRKILWKRD